MARMGEWESCRGLVEKILKLKGHLEDQDLERRIILK